jgi:hypothetical protein
VEKSATQILDETGQIVSESIQKCNVLNRFFGSQSLVDDAGIGPPNSQLRTQSILDSIIVEVHKVCKNTRTECF